MIPAKVATAETNTTITNTIQILVFSVCPWQALPSIMTGAGSWHRLWSVHPEGMRSVKHTLRHHAQVPGTVEGYSRDLALAYSE